MYIVDNTKMNKMKQVLQLLLLVSRKSDHQTTLSDDRSCVKLILVTTVRLNSFCSSLYKLYYTSIEHFWELQR